MFRLWEIFARKRILGTPETYYYPYSGIAFWSGYIAFFAFSYSLTKVVTLVVMAVTFLLTAFLISYVIARRLQDAVFMMDLPEYLKNREICCDNYSNCSKSKYDSKDEPSHIFFPFSTRHPGMVNQPADIHVSDNSTSDNVKQIPISEIGNGQCINDYQNDISTDIRNCNSFGNNSKLHEQIEQSDTKQVGCNPGPQDCEHMGLLHWICRSCAPSFRPYAKFDNTVSDFKLEQSFGAKLNGLDTQPQRFHDERMTELMKNSADIKANQKMKGKCKYVRHLTEPPFSRYNLKDKLSIIITSPVWLFHLLLDPGPIRIISPEKYYACSSTESSGFVIKDELFIFPPCGAVWDFVVGCTFWGLVALSVQKFFL
nr:hypothetical protein [Desulfurispora thermophila]